MPILSVGKTSRAIAGWGRRSRVSGVTLVEMVVVVAIIAILAAISFPAISSGLESIRLSTASDSLVSFLNAALNRAERRQEVVEIAISRQENTVWLYTTEPGFERKLEMPSGISIQQVLPELPEEPEGPRRFMLYPGGTPPRIGVRLVNRRGTQRIVRVDPVTGMPQIETPES